MDDREVVKGGLFAFLGIFMLVVALRYIGEYLECGCLDESFGIIPRGIQIVFGDIGLIIFNLALAAGMLTLAVKKVRIRK